MKAEITIIRVLFKLVGTKSNKMAIGAKVTSHRRNGGSKPLKCGQAEVISQAAIRVLHFGLANRKPR